MAKRDKERWGANSNGRFKERNLSLTYPGVSGKYGVGLVDDIDDINELITKGSQTIEYDYIEASNDVSRCLRFTDELRNLIKTRVLIQPNGGSFITQPGEFPCYYSKSLKMNRRRSGLITSENIRITVRLLKVKTPVWEVSFMPLDFIVRTVTGRSKSYPQMQNLPKP